MTKKVVVIGGNGAGMSAASQVKRRRPNWNVTVFEKGSRISFAACGMPYYLAGRVPSPGQLVELLPEEAVRERGIDLRLNCEVKEIKPKEKAVLVKSARGEAWEPFDYLVIATGALPQTFPFVPEKPRRVFTLRGLSDMLVMQEFLQAEKPKKCAVMGAGYIGLEMAETFKTLGLETHLVHRRSDLAKNFEKEISDRIKEELVKNGVVLQLDTDVKGMRETERGVVLETGKGEIEYDFVLLGFGVVPNTALAKACGIELGIKGAIRVNEYMQTNYDYIYAAGDCAEAVNRVSGEKVYVPLALKANKEGLVAGLNITGKKTSFKGVLGSAVLKIFDLGVAMTGLTLEQAQAKFEAVKFDVTSPAKARYYQPEKIFTVVVAEKGTGRILGAQLAGPLDAVKRIDTFACAIHNGMTLDDLFELDLAYAPPFSPVYDPVLVAARVGRKRLDINSY